MHVIVKFWNSTGLFIAYDSNPLFAATTFTLNELRKVENQFLKKWEKIQTDVVQCAYTRQQREQKTLILKHNNKNK